jgi:hypothetical protein
VMLCASSLFHFLYPSSSDHAFEQLEQLAMRPFVELSGVDSSFLQSVEGRFCVEEDEEPEAMIQVNKSSPSSTSLPFMGLGGVPALGHHKL